MRIKLILAYEGTAYEGWQAQITPRQPSTIQGAIEAALLKLTGASIRIIGAGRTDSGVHALGQVCHADVPPRDWDWRKRLNAILPPDIRVVAVENVSESFHARKDAIAKTYFYNFWVDADFVTPSWRNFAWHCGPLNTGLMHDALACLLGRHNFASFQNAGTPVQNTEREITELALTVLAPDLCPTASAPPLLRFSITGTGFLKQMVRNMAGCLVAIGKGRLALQELPVIMAARSRRALPTPTAPAKGLFLRNVRY